MPKIAYINKRFSDNSLDVIDRANAILVEYEQQGFDLTLRQLYYQFVSRGLIPNTDREYKKLGSIVNDGRMAGRIDWDHIVDRTRNLRSISTWDDPAHIIRGAAAGYAIDKWATQDYRLEVWIEKDALVGVIDGICRQLAIPYFSCRGYTSQSEMWSAGQRLMRHIEDGKRVRILHLGDHDPSGIDMSRDIEDRLRLFIATDHLHMADEPPTGLDERELSEWAFGWVEEWFSIERLALNWDQITQYEPPPNPAKVTDSRAASYIGRFGRESWELDALEPSVIAQLIEEAVYGVRDVDRWAAAVEREDADHQRLAAISRRWPEVVEFIEGTVD